MTLRRVLTSVMHGIGFAFDQLTTESQLEVVASKWMRELDLALHPWGEPGVVPTEPGDYWLAGALRDRVSAVTMQLWTKGPEWFGEANVGSHGHLVRMAQQFGYQFRTRWTPAPPTGGE